MIEITKSSLKTSKRLKTLESEMFTIIKESEENITIQELKNYFNNRASLKTTMGILVTSDKIGVSESKITGTIVSVTYSITGIALENIYIGGDGSNASNGTLSNVLMNSNNSIELRIYQNNPVNQQYSFTTSYIGNIDDTYTQTNKPITGFSTNETIFTKKDD